MQISRDADQAPPFPYLHRAGCLQGVGEYWIFSSYSSGFGYGFEAVGIMVGPGNFWPMQFEILKMFKYTGILEFIPWYRTTKMDLFMNLLSSRNKDP
jgi:hypothetical protein